MKMKLFILILFLSVCRAAAQTLPVRSGKHAFTIQWIGFNKTKPGTAEVRPAGGNRYSIRGEQRDRETGDFVRIDGTFSADGRVLHFDGTIVSRVSYINGGAPCTRTGEQEFRSTGVRRYWRLQQMLNCDGESTDYIDIFF